MDENVKTAEEALARIRRNRDALKDQVEALETAFGKNPDPTLGDQLELAIASQKWGRAFNDAMDAKRLIAEKGDDALAILIDEGMVPGMTRLATTQGDRP